MTAAERALLLAAFSAALGFGMLLPLLPLYLSASGAEQAWHMAALPVLFLTGAALSAPMWGHLSDRVPRVRVLVGGLAGSMAATIPFLLEHSIAALYAYQAAAGVAFGAVGPIVLAMLFEAAASGARGRGVAWFGGATLAGYLVGPAIAGWIAALAGGEPAHRPVILALSVHVVLTAAALVLVMACSRRNLAHTATRQQEVSSGAAWASVGAALLVAFLIGGFEIGAALYVRSPLHLGPKDVALIFSACSASMIAAQLVILPRLPARISRVKLALRCIILGAALLAVMGVVQSHPALIAIAGLQGASLGLAVGLLSFEAAAVAGIRRGSVLGFQNAAVNAGQALGSAAGATAFLTLGVAAFPALGAALLAAAALVRAPGKTA